MYPKVKVREDIEETDQYDYERSSLQSLKAFEWLSLDHYSTDESPGSVVRIPGSNFPKSPTPAFQASKEEMNKNNKAKAIIGGSNKYVRATSAPRLRSSPISSSPDSNGAIGSKTQTRRELLSPLKSHNSCLNRHIRCKISAGFGDAEFASHHGHNKKHIRVKGRPTPADDKQRQKNDDNRPRFS